MCYEQYLWSVCPEKRKTQGLLGSTPSHNSPESAAQPCATGKLVALSLSIRRYLLLSVLLQSKLGRGTGKRSPTQRQRGTWGVRKGQRARDSGRRWWVWGIECKTPCWVQPLSPWERVPGRTSSVNAKSLYSARHGLFPCLPFFC